MRLCARAAAVVLIGLAAFQHLREQPAPTLVPPPVVQVPVHQDDTTPLPAGGDSDASTSSYQPPASNGSAGAPAAALVFVLSAATASSATRRNNIRVAWASGGGSCLSTLFVLGSSSGGGVAQLAGDVLTVPSPEGYHVISSKLLRALHWLVHTSELRPAFVAKTDDDAYVCPAALLATLAPLPTRRLYLGSFSTHTPVRATGDRWTDAPYARMFPFVRAYPPYAQGAFYVLSADLVAAVVALADVVLRAFNGSTAHVPANEDAMIGTLVACVDQALRGEPGHEGAAEIDGWQRSLAIRVEATGSRPLLQRSSSRFGAPGRAGSWVRFESMDVAVRGWLTRTRGADAYALKERMERGKRLREGTAAAPVATRWTETATDPAASALRREACRDAKLVAVHALTAAELLECAGLRGRAHTCSVAPPHAPLPRRPSGRCSGQQARRVVQPARGLVLPRLHAAAAEQQAAASVSPGTTLPAIGMTSHEHRRIAFCFLLGYGNIAQPDAWLAFFRGASPTTTINATHPGDDPVARLFSVYVHQDDPTAARARRGTSRGAALGGAALPLHPFWAEHLLPPRARVPTSYENGSSLERARMALFKFAYDEDSRNFKFVLLSESCVPLRPLAAMHALLTRDARPRLELMPGNGAPMGFRPGKRWIAALEPLLPEAKRQLLLQNRQWLIAGRREVERFPSAEWVQRFFGRMARAEEHVFSNVLVHALNYTLAEIDVGCVTYQRFLKNEGYRQPLPCYRGLSGVLELEHTVESEVLRARSERGCLFARKFADAAHCNLACLVASGFRRFGCPYRRRGPP